MARFRAPSRNGEVLAEPGFGAIPDLVAANRRKLDRGDVIIDGLTLRDLRSLARREALDGCEADPSAPLLLAGHQPELAHPGVWVKNFALNGLARKVVGTPLNLIVDNDTLKNPLLRFPVLRGDKAHIESLHFDRLDGERPYENRPVLDAELFRSFSERAAPLWANWGFEPLLPKVWRSGHNVGEVFTTIRCECERRWGCRNLDLPVSRLSRTQAFGHFARHILNDLPRFRAAYNTAIRAYRKANRVRSDNHPAPELAEGEAPFWVHTSNGQRKKATATSDVQTLRPRALTLTLFARLCLGDFFIHGIGGGKYDEVTDAIIRDYFGIEPPAYQVLSATLHLPIPAFPSTAEDLKRAERRDRDLHWNAQAFLSSDEAIKLLNLAAKEPPRREHAARKSWFGDLRALKERLRGQVSDRMAEAEREFDRIRAEASANAILQRRDYSWVLYPEATLRPFLQRFLELR